MARLLRLRFRSKAPRRPPRVILLGPPGSGRSTQAAAIAKRFGLVHICTRSLLKNEIARNPEIGQLISRCIDRGELVPDHLVQPLVENRLK